MTIYRVNLDVTNYVKALIGTGIFIEAETEEKAVEEIKKPIRLIAEAATQEEAEAAYKLHTKMFKLDRFSDYDILQEAREEERRRA